MGGIDSGREGERECAPGGGTYTTSGLNVNGANGMPCCRAFFQYRVGCSSTPAMPAATAPSIVLSPAHAAGLTWEGSRIRRWRHNHARKKLNGHDTSRHEAMGSSRSRGWGRECELQQQGGREDRGGRERERERETDIPQPTALHAEAIQSSAPVANSGKTARAHTVAEEAAAVGHVQSPPRGHRMVRNVRPPRLHRGMRGQTG